MVRPDNGRDICSSSNIGLVGVASIIYGAVLAHKEQTEHGIFMVYAAVVLSVTGALSKYYGNMVGLPPLVVFAAWLGWVKKKIQDRVHPPHRCNFFTINYLKIRGTDIIPGGRIMGLLSKLLGKEEKVEEVSKKPAQEEAARPSSFEEVMERMGRMTEEEVQTMIEEKSKICAEMCGKCPSYEGTGETKLLFCATGKSDIITEEKGCVCGGCQVQEDMKLRWDYYCMKGTGKEQAGL